jgi:hypothetical protein
MKLNLERTRWSVSVTGGVAQNKVWLLAVSYVNVLLGASIVS